MNRDEAIACLHQYLDDLEAVGYTALTRRVGEDQAFEMRSEIGMVYQLEVSILWDGKPGGAIRIIGSIDDGGLSAFLPLTDSRLVEPC
ncbi:MAG: hypothetical protein A2Z71_10610 [Chloroflexi bacterium RBG_13_50_21]|nr:MAG: hypothetical protein A2Z71_10610 [Chloroflexi bacterium RBG_13_50_21]OGO66778.1 MAG: hypothetical protein A2029_03305 [Chloroflexi bacterium RBG_19FT_COMBO_47_9]